MRLEHVNITVPDPGGSAKKLCEILAGTSGGKGRGSMVGIPFMWAMMAAIWRSTAL